MNLYYKYYACEASFDGKTWGDVLVKVPFYISAMKAHETARREIQGVFDDFHISNFRRVE